MWLLFRNALSTIKRQKILVLFLSLLTMFGSATVSYGTFQSNTVTNAYESLITNSGEYDFIYQQGIHQFTNDGITYCLTQGITVNNDSEEALKEQCADEIYKKAFSEHNNIEEVTRELKLMTPTDVENGHFFMVTKNILTGNIAKNWTVKGRDAQTAFEATVTPKYAQANNIKLGDKIDIKGVEYTITGETVSYDFAAPVINIRYLYPNFQKETVVYTTPEGYDRISPSLLPSRDIDEITYLNGDGNAYNKTLGKYFIDYKDFVFHKLHPSAHTIALRVTAIINQVESTKMMNKVLMIFILSLTVLVMMVVIKNVIKSNKKHIGVLKALGYKSNQIAVSYISYALVVGIIGGILGIIAGYFLYLHYLPVFNDFFITDLFINPTPIWQYLLLLVMPFFIIVLPIYLLTWFALRKKPLQLISDRDGTKSNILVRLSSKVLKKRKFKTRFKYAQAFKSPTKLISMTTTILVSTVLMLFMFSALNVFTEIFDASFGAKQYDGSIRYSSDNHTIVINEDDVKEYDWSTFKEDDNLQGKTISFFQLREGYEELKPLIPNFDTLEQLDLIKSRLLLDLPVTDQRVIDLKKQFITIGAQVKEEGSEPYPYIKNKFIKDQNDRNFLLEEALNKIKISSLSFYGIANDSKLFNVWQQHPNSLKKIEDYKGEHWPVVINSFAANRANIKIGDVIEVAINEKLVESTSDAYRPYEKVVVLDIINEYDGSAGYTTPETITNMHRWYVNDNTVSANWNGKLYVGNVKEGTTYTSLAHPITKDHLGVVENNYIYKGNLAIPQFTDKSAPLLYTLGLYADNFTLDLNKLKPLNPNYRDVVDLQYSVAAFTQLIDLTKASMNSYIIFAWFIGGSVIVITTIIVIEDNKKMIVTLKTLGYENKDISKMVLTIYIPFIIFAFLISIPITNVIFDIIENALRNGSNTELPLSTSLGVIIYAFSAVVVVYAISFVISYNKLKKIRLSEV